MWEEEGEKPSVWEALVRSKDSQHDTERETERERERAREIYRYIHIYIRTLNPKPYAPILSLHLIFLKGFLFGLWLGARTQRQVRLIRAPKDGSFGTRCCVCFLGSRVLGSTGFIGLVGFRVEGCETRHLAERLRSCGADEGDRGGTAKPAKP